MATVARPVRRAVVERLDGLGRRARVRDADRDVAWRRAGRRWSGRCAGRSRRTRRTPMRCSFCWRSTPTTALAPDAVDVDAAGAPRSPRRSRPGRRGRAAGRSPRPRSRRRRRPCAMMSSMVSLGADVGAARPQRRAAGPTPRPGPAAAGGSRAGPRRLQNRSTVVSDVWPPSASSLMVRAAAGARVGEHLLGDPVLGGRQRGPQRPQPDEQRGGARRRGRAAPADVRPGHGSTYGVSAAPAPPLRDEGLRVSLAVERRTPAGCTDPDAVDEHAAPEVAARRSCSASAAAPHPGRASARRLLPATGAAARRRPRRLVVGRPRSRSSKGSAVQVAPPSRRGLQGEQVGRPRCRRTGRRSGAPRGATSQRARWSRVAVVRPAYRRTTPSARAAAATPRASASPCAATRRAGLLLPQLRLGCTRLVSRIANEREAKSMTIEVPV